MDTLIDYPTELNSKVRGEIDRVYQVDFTGDSKGDFIVQTKKDKEGKVKEVWLTSDFLLFNMISKYVQEYDFMAFINLDIDPELELYSASGSSDGIDYAIYDLNMKTGKQELLFYFNPVIIENQNDYWGYPWDADGVMSLLMKTGELKIYSAIDHDIEREGTITQPKNQKVLPVIFLTGHSTQPEIKVEEIRNRSWKTLEEIIKLCTTENRAKKQAFLQFIFSLFDGRPD
tara:strand:- start:602 stop:1291 length:690 start_codon:yes stop_codon:yes gene_type:complete